MQGGRGRRRNEIPSFVAALFFTEGIKSEMNPDFVAVMHDTGLFTDPILILWKKGLIL